MSQRSIQIFGPRHGLTAAVVVLVLGAAYHFPSHASSRPAVIVIDYPEDGSIFPPEITPPTFFWRDRSLAAQTWHLDISFTDGSSTIHAVSSGPPPSIGKIDPNCVADTNQPPKLTDEQAAAHTWVPEVPLWAAIKKHSVAGAAIVSITGFPLQDALHPVSHGSVSIRTSRDPAGAPIFYRDVPLMPSELERGVIKPLAAGAIPLVAWRLRSLAESTSRLVMDDLPVCANCHSFSADGKTMGMDLDGLQNNRGLYFVTTVAPETRVGNKNVVQWTTAKGPLKGSVRAGFLSQVSPDGRFVATTIDPVQASGLSGRSNYYVANFKDYRFLQVFYPTRGILSWYSKAGGILQPLAGADDPRFVQMGAVWSPDGRYLVFCRAAAKDPSPVGAILARFANDPNELPMQYDLYRIPFRDGKGGRPEPIAGASGNGMSNSFPKVSPDGRWIVFVKARNGLLMRPDSQLYIVPAEGGEARRMRCNTRLMNSWHSFSPNGRWLVFSSKARSPYTQMYLTHIDEDGNDSPPILVDNATAANRAVNLPEFVNIEPDGLRKIGGPALDYYRLADNAAYLQKHGKVAESVAAWTQASTLNPDDPFAQSRLGSALLMLGRREEAGVHLRKAAELKWRAAVAGNSQDAAAYHNLGLTLLEQGRLDEALPDLRRAAELDPSSAPVHSDLGAALLRQEKTDEALTELRTAVSLDARFAPAYYQMGLALESKGESEEAIEQWQKALQIDPHYREVHDSLAEALYARGDAAAALSQWREGTQDAAALRRMAWALATGPVSSARNGSLAVAVAARAVQLSPVKDAALWDILAAAYAEADRFADAVATAQRALASAHREDRPDLTRAIEARIRLYQAGKPFREAPAGRH